MMSIARRAILMMGLTLALAVVSPPTISAASPRLHLTCGAPTTYNTVTCWLAGSGFRPHERLNIRYRLTYLALTGASGKHPHKTYRRVGSTTSQGAFTRPGLTFGVVKYHEAFRLTAVVKGTSGDHATVSIVSMPQ